MIEIALTAITAIFTLGIVTGLVSLLARSIRQERRFEEEAQPVNGLGVHPPSAGPRRSAASRSSLATIALPRTGRSGRRADSGLC